MSKATWYEKFGFYDNPLSIKPLEPTIFGYKEELKDLFKGISEGKIILVTGEYGLGKTTIIKHLIRRFSGKKKLIFCSCNRYDHDLDVDNMIVKSGTLLSRIFKKKNRDLILMLDEVHELSEDELSEVYEGYMDNFFKSVICFSSSHDRISFPKEMKSKIDMHITLKGISEEQGINLIKERLQGTEIITDSLIKKIYHLSGKNPRILLSNCEDVIKYAFEKGQRKVSESHLEALK